MATNGARIDFGPLIKALGARGADDKTDGQLLEQFLNERDEAAFAVFTAGPPDIRLTQEANAVAERLVKYSR